MLPTGLMLEKGTYRCKFGKGYLKVKVWQQVPKGPRVRKGRGRLKDTQMHRQTDTSITCFGPGLEAGPSENWFTCYCEITRMTQI